MTKSMTGFSSGTLKLNSNINIIVEIRSVNNRYFDLNFKLDDDLKYLENKIKGLIDNEISRGKLDFRIIKKLNASQENKFSETRVLEAVKALKKISKLSGQDFSSSPTEIINFINLNQAQEKISLDEKKILSFIKRNIKKLNQDREREGNNLALVLINHANQIQRKVKSIQNFFKVDSKLYQKKLVSKLNSVDAKVDNNRLQQELIIYLQKSDIEEENNRIYSHIKEILSLLKLKSPVGKKLDFMMQELNREANTLASKSISTRISTFSVDIKVLIEQMREQIQNIE
jgi:uncharacterized protein (TIGR00255 family)